MRLLASMYNDNVNLSEDATAVIQSPFGPVTLSTQKESDFIIRPLLTMNALWPITELNTFRLDLGIGYAFYLDHSNYNTNGVLVSPGSQLAFDIFVGDFRINLHDRFSLEQDPVSEIRSAMSLTTDVFRTWSAFRFCGT